MENKIPSRSEDYYTKEMELEKGVSVATLNLY